jgi:hypothetical protein
VIELRVRTEPAAVGAGGFGRRTVVVSSALVHANVDGTLPSEQVAAVIAHAAGLVRGGWVRTDPVIGFWSLPWLVLRGLADGLARAGRRLTPTSLAWRCRVAERAVSDGAAPPRRYPDGPQRGRPVGTFPFFGLPLPRPSDPHPG